MVVTDLKANQRPQSRRYHPLRSIVKQSDGLYSVSAPVRHGPAEEATSLSDLRLIVNALQLNQSVLARELAVVQERGTPFNGVVVPNAVLNIPADVTPMRKTGPTHIIPTEQSLAAQASPEPVPASAVSGSLALALPVPLGPTPAPGPKLVEVLKKSDVEPHHIKPPYTELTPRVEEASNDDDWDVVPEEVKAKLKDFTDVDPNTLADMAFQYGMDIIEASEILSNEWSLREDHCNRVYGESRATIQVGRLAAQKGIVTDTWQPSVTSSFAGWHNEMDALAPMLRMRAKQTIARDEVRRLIFGALGYRTTALVSEGEQTARQRLVNTKKDNMRTRINQHKGTTTKYVNTDDIAATLEGVGVPSVTTNSQMKMIGSFINEVGDTLRRTKVAKALGLGPKLRTAKLREQQEAEDKEELISGTSSFAYAHRYPNLERNLKGMKTQRILRPAKAWSELDSMTATEKLDTIGAELIKRGVNTPGEVAVMRKQIESLAFDMGETKDKTVADTKLAA